MTSSARPWLPANAISDLTVQTRVSERATIWAARWLSDPPGLSVSTNTVTRPTKLPSAFTCWSNDDNTLLMSIETTSMAKLAVQIIDAPAGKPNSADLALYRDIAKASFTDLLSDLIPLFQCNDGLNDAPESVVDAATRYAFAFAAGGPSFDLYVDAQLVTQARRTVAKGARPGAPLGALSDAIGRQRVDVGAAIGRATVGLSDLYGLTCGDIIVLDHTCDESVPLTINGAPMPAASARIQRAETSLALAMIQVEQPA